MTSQGTLAIDRQDAPALREAQALLSLLQEVARTLPTALPADVPHLDAARERIYAGLPAVSGEPLISGGILAGNSQAFLAPLERHDGAVGRTARTLATSLDAAGAAIPWDELAAVALAGDWEAVESLVAPHGVDAHALGTVLDWAVRPVLQAGRVCLDALAKERRHQRGRCWCCGALPGLAERHSASGEDARMLRCLRCLAGWSFPVLACPACGTRDHRQLGYLHAEGELEIRRVERCDACSFYVKGVATLSALSADDLLRMDLTTTALDVLAAKRGYWRAS